MAHEKLEADVLDSLNVSEPASPPAGYTRHWWQSNKFYKKTSAGVTSEVGSGTIGGSTPAAHNVIMRSDGISTNNIQGSQVRIDDSGYLSLANFVFGDTTYNNRWARGASANKTLSSDILTTGLDMNCVVISQTGTSDDLKTITVTGGITGETIYLRAASGHTITVKHGTGNILLVGLADLVLSEVYPIVLNFDGTNWKQDKAGSSSSGTIGGSTGANDNRLLRSDGTGGATLQASGITVNDSDSISGATIPYASNTMTGLIIGTDVQAYDADLAALAALSTTGFIRRTGAGTADTVPAIVVKTYKLDLVSNQTTTSTSYGDVTNSSQSHTFTKANAIVWATVTSSNSGNNNTDVRIMVNGNAGADAIVSGVIGNLNATSPSWGERFTGIAGGSVTVKLQFKVSAGTGTLAARHPLIYTILEYD